MKEITKKKFLEVFGNRMVNSKLGLAWDAVALGLASCSGWSLLSICNDLQFGKFSRISAEVRHSLRNSPSDIAERSASGFIKWETGNSHTVKFTLSLVEEPNCSPALALSKVEMGDDKSLHFYPSIKEGCRKRGITFEVINKEVA